MDNPIKGKDVFLSGPMSGIRDYNVKAFAEAHARIRGLCPYHVYNPAIEYLLSDVDAPCGHDYWMQRCIRELLSGPYDVLVQLPGWEESDGARLEAEVARACGVVVIPLDELLRMGTE